MGSYPTFSSPFWLYIKLDIYFYIVSCSFLHNAISREHGGREYKGSSNGNPCEIVNLWLHNLCAYSGMLLFLPWTIESHAYSSSLQKMFKFFSPTKYCLLIQINTREEPIFL